ncbi:MAG TPA: PHB depolymerase family esterase [Polyangia bacterium]|nr:PHB depolymerase family esterase [Polyangia bacterium]
MQVRLLRSVTLASLLALSAASACSQDSKTHASFTVTGVGGDGGGGAGTGGTGASNVDAGTGGSTSTNTDGSVADGMGTTTGCGQDPGQDYGKYVEFHMNVAGPDSDTTNKLKVRDRIYYVRLPKTYDSSTPTRVVYLGPGCGGTTSGDVINLNLAAAEQAILVAIIPVQTQPGSTAPPEFGQCFDERPASVEYPFFDALHKKIESTYCVDPARQFYAGFSTGARLGNMLGCKFPDVLRAFATVQGALPPLPTCTDHPVANFTLADTLESGNPYQANVMASQHVLAANKCSDPTASPSTPPPKTETYDPGTMAACTGYGGAINCVDFTGCDKNYPVVFCTTTGAGHTPCENWSDFAFWNFFKKF